MSVPRSYPRGNAGSNGRPQNVESLAAAKRLPLTLLLDVGVKDLPGGGIAIPYHGLDGYEMVVRRRDVPGRPRFQQPAGVPLCPYGLSRLDLARRRGHVYLTEGESDAWALWACELPALGLPGSGTAKALEAEHLSGISDVYILPDSDPAGESFAAGVRDRLKALGFPGRVWRLRVPPPHKDVSDWRAAAPERFAEDLAAAVDKAERLDVAPAMSSPRPCSAAKPPPTAAVRTLAAVQARPVEWMWEQWIPRGAITILDGDPGLGKSTLTLDLAARVSRGWPMPPAAGCDAVSTPAGVLLLNAEDSPETTIRPRLAAAGADLARVHVLDAVRQGEDERPPVLPHDLDLIADEMRTRGARLLVVDPLLAFMDGQLDAHKDQDVRRCLHRLKILAESTGAAVLIIRHLNKLIGGPALYRGGGSIGITGAARSALLVGRHPAEPHQCVLASAKCNLSARPASLAYTHEPEGDVARIGWVGTVDLEADDILGHPGGRRRESAGEQAAKLIRDFLAAGPKSAADLEEALVQGGFGERAGKIGRKLAGVRTWRVGFGGEGRWMVEIPAPPEAAAEAAADQGEEVRVPW